ncbi:hypothetical protein Q0M94_02250 [Deinococcus radiomollis]|uniref:hypothetical protein n=1 Tax=Deinococcus radiomollis TaxID=468916 RepID=UPI003892A985
MKPADLPALLHEAQSRAAFRKELLIQVTRHLAEMQEEHGERLAPEWATASTDHGLITTSQGVQEAAVKLARSVAPRHTAAEQEFLATSIHAAALKAAQDRNERKAGMAREHQPLKRPAKLNPVDWLRISTEERKLINLIAASIIRGSVVDLDEPPDEPPPARQPKGDSLEQAMKTAGRRSYSWAKVAVLELLNGNVELATEYAKASQLEDLRYSDAQRHLSTEPARFHTGRYHRGVIFKIGVPRSVTEEGPDNVPIQRLVFDPFYFTLVILWGADGSTLEVANATEIEARSGIDVGETGWSDFIGWLHHQDRRLTGTVGGRPVKDMKHLIYREDRGALATRELIRDGYPGAIRVFEALRRTLTRVPHESLGRLSTFEEHELEWGGDEEQVEDT